VKPRRLPEKCAFCGLGNLSKEHFWPQWAESLLRSPAQSGSYRELFVVRTEKTKIVSHRHKERPGHVTTKKFAPFVLDVTVDG